MLALLREHRTFRLLLIAKMTSAAGDATLLLALPYFLYVKTGSVLASASVFVLAALPNAALGPILGGLADRIDPRRLLISCDLISIGASIALVPVAAGHASWLVYPSVFVLVTCGQTVNFTRGALTPRLVGAEQVLSANSLESAAFAVVSLAAPALGGLLYGIFGLTWLTLFNGITFAVSAACVVASNLPPSSSTSASIEEHVQVRAALFLLHPRELCGKLIAIAGGYFVISTAATVLLIPYIRTYFHGDALTVGLLSGVSAAGAVLGAVLGLRVEGRLGILPAIGAMLLLDGAARLTFTFVPSLLAACGLLLVASAGASALLALLQTALQRATPTHLLGRVIGLTWMVGGWCSIFGMLAFSAQVPSVSVRHVLQEGAVVGLVLGLVALASLRRESLKV